MGKKKPTQLKYKDIPALRKKLLKKQGGVCIVCLKRPKRPVLDHSHTKRVKGTGLVRGVLCNGCNVLIGKIENNCVRYGIKQKNLPKILEMIAVYLRRKHRPYKHPSEMPKKRKLTKRSYAALRKAYHNHYRGRAKLPDYPKSGTLIKPLNKMFILLDVKPKFYGEKK